MAQTNIGGEIIALDTAGYGSFTANKSVTVRRAPGIHAAISAASDAITVAATASDRVTLRNLVLIGTGAPTASWSVPPVRLQRRRYFQLRVAGPPGRPIPRHR